MTQILMDSTGRIEPQGQGFFSEVGEGAGTAGRSAFRFWARFGLIFRAVLTASSTEAAMKAELPAGMLSYPASAWVFVLLGYLCAPVFGAFGLVYKCVEIPARAAWRVLKALVPQLVRLLDFLGRFLRRILPTAGAFISAGVNTAAISAAAGASLAAPSWVGVAAAPFSVDKQWKGDWLRAFPEMAGMLLLRLSGFVVSLIFAAAGALAGFVTGLPAALISAVLAGLSRVSEGGEFTKAYERWQASLKASASTFIFHKVESQGEPAGNPRILIRLLNAPFVSLIALPAAILTGLRITFLHSERAPWTAPAGEPSTDDVLRVWARLGLAVDSGLLNRRFDENLLREPSARLADYPALARPAVLAGQAAAGVSSVFSSILSAAGKAVDRVWAVVIDILSAEAVRRMLKAVRDVIVRAVPFILGLILGTAVSLVFAAASGAAMLGEPVWRNAVDGLRCRRTGLTGLLVERLAQVLGALCTVAAGGLGMVLGAVFGLPACVLIGASCGMSGSGKGPATDRLHGWDMAFRAAGRSLVSRFSQVSFPYRTQEAGLFQVVVRSVNGLLHAASAVLWGLPLIVSMMLRPRVEPPAKEEAESGERARPEGWRETAVREASDALHGTLCFWRQASDLSGFPGAAIGLPAAMVLAPLAGLAGAVEVPARAALEALRRSLRFIRPALDLAFRIVRRASMFCFGAAVGAVGGAAGSALFGALLLGRPWFKYVVSADFDERRITRFLAVWALRAFAAAAGVLFGLLGMCFGLLAALPYSLTFMLAAAFAWGSVGGRSEAFFEHWRLGALPAEMRRVSRLTDSFEFPEQRLMPMDGWVRFGIIFPAVLAAAAAAIVAGLAAYARSVRSAFLDMRGNKPLPAALGVSDDVIWRTVSRGACMGGKTLGGLGVLAALAAAPTGVSWTVFFALLFLSGPAGALMGALLGAWAGSLLWLDRRLVSPKAL